MRGLSRLNVIALLSVLPWLGACGGDSFNSSPSTSDEDAGANAPSEEPEDSAPEPTAEPEPTATEPEGTSDEPPPASSEPTPDEPPGLGLVVGDTVTIEQLPAAVARAVCNRLYACCSEAQRGASAGTTVDECTQNYTILIGLLYVGSLNESQREARSRYHGEQGAQCLKDVDSLGCELQPVEICTEAVEPLTAAGEFCKLDLECVDGACLTDQCGAPQPDDGPCADAADCESGYCSSATSTCQPLAAQDEACTANANCESGNCVPASLTCGEPIPGACQ